MNAQKFANWMEAYAKSNRLIGTFNGMELRTKGLVVKGGVVGPPKSIDDVIEVCDFLTNMVNYHDRASFRGNSWLMHLDEYIRKIIPTKHKNIITHLI